MLLFLHCDYSIIPTNAVLSVCSFPMLQYHCYKLLKEVTIHQVTIMLTTSKNVLFPGHNHLLTTGTDDPPLAGTRAIIKLMVDLTRVISTSG